MLTQAENRRTSEMKEVNTLPRREARRQKLLYVDPKTKRKPSCILCCTPKAGANPKENKKNEQIKQVGRPRAKSLSNADPKQKEKQKEATIYSLL